MSYFTARSTEDEGTIRWIVSIGKLDIATSPNRRDIQRLTECLNETISNHVDAYDEMEVLI